MAEYSIQINLTFKTQTPLHIGTGLSRGGVIDKTVIKCSTAKPTQNVYIPGATIKGRIKYLYTLLYREYISTIIHNNQVFCRNDNIEDCCAICQLFGSRYHRGKLIFSDARLIEYNFLGLPRQPSLNDPYLNYLQTELRRGVKISRLRKTALDKHLFTIETASAGLAYQTRISGSVAFPGGVSNLPQEIKLLFASIKMLDRIGGGKSRGLGVIEPEIGANVNGREQNIDKLILSLFAGD